MRTIFLLTAVLFATSAFANLSEPPWPSPGQITGGPFISEHCIITGELLKVDLRPLENLEEGIITARYNFNCDTVNTSLNLIFVARNLSGKDFRILLDGKPVSGDTTSLLLVPDHWLLPRKLPWSPRWSDSSLAYDSTGWSDAQRYYYERENFNDYILFTIGIDSGQHVLEVTYNVDVPQSYRGALINHCFTYILSPAADWKSYSELNLELYIPNEWEVQSNLDLTLLGDHYTGYWKQLPADYFYVITGRSQENADALENTFLFTGWGLLLICIIWVLNRFKKRLIKQQISKGIFWTIPLWLMPAAIIVFFIIFAWRDAWMKLWYGAQLQPGFTHSDDYVWIFGFIPLSIIAIVIGYVIQSFLMIPHRADKN